MPFAMDGGKPGDDAARRDRETMPNLVEILERQVTVRRRMALAKARLTLDRLAAEGFEARLIGSLARGTFKAHSDVAFLIQNCPADRKYTIEGLVEELMAPLPFSVIDLDEVDPARRAVLLRESRDAPAPA